MIGKNHEFCIWLCVLCGDERYIQCSRSGLDSIKKMGASLLQYEYYRRWPRRRACADEARKEDS